MTRKYPINHIRLHFHLFFKKSPSAYELVIDNFDIFHLECMYELDVLHFSFRSAEQNIIFK